MCGNFDPHDLEAYMGGLNASTILLVCAVCGGKKKLNEFKDHRPGQMHGQTTMHQGAIDFSLPGHRQLFLPLVNPDSGAADSPAHYKLQPELVSAASAASSLNSAETQARLRVCETCFGALKKGKIPEFCYATYPLTPTPAELRGLTTFEQSVISLALPMLTVVKLKAPPGAGRDGHQLALKRGTVLRQLHEQVDTCFLEG